MFGLSTLELRACGLLLVVAAVLLWLGVHDAKIRSAATAPVLAEIKSASDAASAAQAIHGAKVDATQQGNLHEAVAMDAARVASARALADDVRRMRDDAVRPRQAVPASGASGASGSAGLPGTDLVPGELYRRALAARAGAESDAADLAGYAECLRTGGQLCALNYRSLRQP